jgi:hypothetical protein
MLEAVNVFKHEHETILLLFVANFLSPGGGGKIGLGGNSALCTVKPRCIVFEGDGKQKR